MRRSTSRSARVFPVAAPPRRSNGCAGAGDRSRRRSDACARRQGNASRSASMALRSSSPTSFAAAAEIGMSWRLGLDFDGEVGEAGSGAEPAEEWVMRCGVTGCDIAGERRGRGGGGVEEMEDEYDMNDPVDDMEEEDEYQVPMVGDSDAEEEDDEDQSHKRSDTSAADARNGKDIQGIPWENLTITRDAYRQARLEQYKNYENIPHSGEAAMRACKSTEAGTYYEFRQNTRSVKSTISHFQLRNLVWATSKHDVYLLLHYSVLHWSALSGVDTEIMDVHGHVAPSEKHPGSLLEGFFHTQISTMAVKDNFLVAGGFQGELICKHLDREGISFCCRTTFDENAITNALEIFNTSGGALHFIASNNDCGVRQYDMERYQLYKHFRFDWPVNHTSLSPDGKLVTVVGDDTDALLIDASSGKTVHSMKGHLDYSFASAWSPDGRTFATGNQDKTCRIWDVRNLSQSVHVLRGNIGAIRSIRFTSDGQFLSMAEAADFVHIFDIKSDYNKRQELDFFGDVSGMSFSPDTDTLYVGVSDRTYSSLLQFGRRYNYSYLDSLL